MVRVPVVVRPIFVRQYSFVYIYIYIYIYIYVKSLGNSSIRVTNNENKSLDAQI